MFGEGTFQGLLFVERTPLLKAPSLNIVIIVEIVQHLWAGMKTTTSGLLMKVTDFFMELEEEVESRLASVVWTGCLI